MIDLSVLIHRNFRLLFASALALIAMMLAAKAFTTMMANIAAVTYRQRTILRHYWDASMALTGSLERGLRPSGRLQAVRLSPSPPPWARRRLCT